MFSGALTKATIILVCSIFVFVEACTNNLSSNYNEQQFENLSSHQKEDVAAAVRQTWFIEGGNNAETMISALLKAALETENTATVPIEAFFTSLQGAGQKMCLIPAGTRFFFLSKTALQPLSNFYFVKLGAKTNPAITIKFPPNSAAQCALTEGYIFFPHFAENDMDPQETKYRRKIDDTTLTNWTVKDSLRPFVYVSFASQELYDSMNIESNRRKKQPALVKLRISLVSSMSHEGQFPELDFVMGVSGKPDFQTFSIPINTTQKEPTPEGLWYVDPNAGQNGLAWWTNHNGVQQIENYNGYRSGKRGLGPFFAPLYLGASSSRTYIGLHHDGDWKTGPGTAGCIGISDTTSTFTEVKKVVGWFTLATTSPYVILTDWNLGMVKKEAQITRSNIVFLEN